MLKKWLDNIGLPNLQPTITDRICSDHFENNDFVMTDDIYGLSNDAVPLIKPQVCILLLGNNNFKGHLIITDFSIFFVESIHNKL